MKPLKCKHKGCRKTHKSPTGYCDKHSAEQTKHPVAVREGRRVVEPRLWEEVSWDR